MGKRVYISGINWFVKMNRYAMKENPGCALLTKPLITNTVFPNEFGIKVTAYSSPQSVVFRRA